MGRFPEPSSHNLKNRPRVMMGGYKVDGKTLPTWEVLIEDLCVLGWYANALYGLYQMIADTNADATRGMPKPTRLEILIDRLPSEQGGDENYKGTLLKQLLLRATNGGAEIMGVPELSDSRQRDLMVDNLAGLRRQLEQRTWKGDRRAAEGLYCFNRKNIGRECLAYHGKFPGKGA